MMKILKNLSASAFNKNQWKNRFCYVEKREESSPDPISVSEDPRKVKVENTVKSTRNAVYRIFTISSGEVKEGVCVEKLELRGAQIIIPAVIVGEQGRGRDRGVIPVHLLPEQQKEWEETGRTMMSYAKIGKTRSEKPKLFAKNKTTSDEEIIGVLRTKIGYRGGNSHTGDRTGETEKNYWNEDVPMFTPFPGKVLAEGTIAQGTAGRMGSGTQLVTLIPKDKVFRTRYSGRLYGAPSAHYYLWDGRKLNALTWEERSVSDIF